MATMTPTLIEESSLVGEVPLEVTLIGQPIGMKCEWLPQIETHCPLTGSIEVRFLVQLHWK
jgi:hypothetical protein